jgi:hypothetical protein
MSPEYASRGNKRRSLRVPVQVEVLLGEADTRLEYAINLSRSGLCMQARQAHSAGERLRLRFRLAPEGKLIETHAEVVWCTCESDLSPGLMFCEVGLRFLGLESEDRTVLDQFVDDNANFWGDDREQVIY